ncbi:RimK family alpha-L-glutamate ligase [Candidatus Woesearchaeota archaeon]|nr:MAG: RimK family alpha-L-glutamate ligase [Candidatus Woesearchaeota archaeon]
MRAALLSLGSKSSKITAQAMRKYFTDVDELNIKEVEVKLSSKGPEVLYQGKPLPDYDCMYLKGSFKYVQILRSVTCVLQEKTYVPIPDYAFTTGHDKLLTQLVLDQAGVPMPTTYISSSTKEAKRILDRVSYPIVIKFPQGTQGKGVTFAESVSSAKSILDAFASLNQPVIVQEFVETGGEDIRAFVVGGKVVAAMKRKALEGEKRSNIHAGAKGEKVELDLETKQIAVKAAKALKLDICGIDILKGPQGPKVIEVNLSPGIQGITEATGIDVANKIAKHLYDATKSFHSTEKVEGEDEDIPKIVTSISYSKGQLKVPELIGKFAGIAKDDEVTISSGKRMIIISKNAR